MSDDNAWTFANQFFSDPTDQGTSQHLNQTFRRTSTSGNERNEEPYVRIGSTMYTRQQFEASHMFRNKNFMDATCMKMK